MKQWPKLWWLLLFIPGLALAATEMELNAPGGGEMDLKRNVMQYFGTDKQLVSARWDNSTLEAKSLEYDREKEIATGKQMVRLTQINPNRTLSCSEIVVDMKRDYLTAVNNVNLKYDETTSFSCNRLEWDRKNDHVQLTGKPEITYNEWRITGEQVEGQVSKGQLVIAGAAQIQGNDATAKAGKMIFNREADKVIMQESPIVIRGNSQLTATEIVYDLKTKKVTANGGVQSKIIKNP